jgi:hypothetical protein
MESHSSNISTQETETRRLVQGHPQLHSKFKTSLSYKQILKKKKKKKKKWGRAVVAHVFNPSTWEAESGGFLSSRPPGLQSEFQDSQGYTDKPCLKKTKKKKKSRIRCELNIFDLLVIHNTDTYKEALT